jgi:hypothetical protein
VARSFTLSIIDPRRATTGQRLSVGNQYLVNKCGKELLDLDDEAFARVVRLILDLESDPRPRGYDVVAGKSNQLGVRGLDSPALPFVDSSTSSKQHQPFNAE